METFYHGTSVLFKKFDIAHALEGDGKAKFGFLCLHPGNPRFD